MRTPYRIATTLVALGAVFPFGATAAHAEVETPLVDQANWFWAEQVGGTIPGSPGVPYPAGLSDPTVPSNTNDLAVAGNPAQQQKDPKGVEKEAYVSFGLTTMPLGATVNSFTFTWPLDQQATSGTAYDTQTPPILVACLPKGGWGQGNLGQHGDQFDGKPQDDCAGAPAGKFDPTAKTYTWDITALAQKWSDGEINFGVAIRNEETYTTPFNLVFAPVDKITTSLDYTPPVPEAPVPTTNPVPPTDNNVVPPPSTGGGYNPTPVTPPVSNVTPSAAPQSSPPAPVVQQPVTRSAARPLTQETGMTGAFWLAMLAGVVLIGVVSLVLGNPEVAVATTRQNGLDRALRRRGAGSPGSAAPTGGLKPRTV